MPKLIKLTKGKETIVNNADFARFGHLNWCASKCRYNWYAVRRARKDEIDRKPSSLIYLHREILGSVEGELCDHKNGYTLDNRRRNLRAATYSQNAINKPHKRSAKGLPIGVEFKADYPREKPYAAYINVGGLRIRLGHYCTCKEAKEARQFGETLYHKEFSYENSRR